MSLASEKKEHLKALRKHCLSDLRHRIHDGRLPVGMRLPTDNALAAEYHISRESIRQILALLADEGLIERVQGRGTLVCRAPMTTRNTRQIQPPLSTPQKQIGLLLYRGIREEMGRLFLDYLAGAVEAARLYNYSVSICYTDGGKQQQEQDIARMVASDIVGLILYPIEDVADSRTVHQLHASHFPLVLIDRSAREVDIDYVGADNRGGAYSGTEHLILLGHRRIGFVYLEEEKPEMISSVRERQQGYAEALRTYGLLLDRALITSDVQPSRGGISPSIVALLQRQDRPDAIQAVNPLVTFDVIQAARALHLRLPQDLALVSFDDEGFSASLSPALTAIAQPFWDIGWRATMLLIRRMGNITAPISHIELPTTLRIRDSCGMPLYIERIRALRHKK